MRTRIFRLLILLICLSLIPAAALAAGENAARIGSKEYATLDEAVKAASSGDTIIVLKDCTTEGLNLSKNLTIEGDAASKPTITFTKYGIALWKKSLTFRNCNIVMNNIVSTPYTAEWNWMAICAQTDSAMSLDNVDMIMNIDPELPGVNPGTHAIYFCGSDELNMTNSNLVITNYPHNAMEWDGATPGYNGSMPSKYHVNMDNSTFLSDHNRSGFAGTFTIRANNSLLDVVNSTGNGSNGSHYYLTDCVVNYSNNGAHGLSAGVLEAVRTPITANNNGYHGIIANFIKFEDSTIQANDNGFNGLRAGTRNYAGMCTLYGYNADMEFLRNGYYAPDDEYSGVVLRNIEGMFDKDCKLVIRDSANNGLRIDDQYTAFTMEEGSDIEIMCNYSNSSDVLGGGNGQGGGVRIVGGSLALPSDARLYNNHASNAGDDIYVTERYEVMGQIRFSDVGRNWALDGEPDCTHNIDGWYVDTDPLIEGGARWNAHGAPEQIHMELYQVPEEPVIGPLALKAAHGIIEPPKTGDSSNAALWTILTIASAAVIVILAKKKGFSHAA